MNDDPIDIASALERIGGEQEFLAELLEIFKADFQEKFPLLNDAVKSGDFDRIREIGHALKGASANLSLLPLQNACKKMEEAGRAHDAQAAGESLELMAEEYERLQAVLPSLFKKGT